jgi:hypothetical protein
MAGARALTDYNRAMSMNPRRGEDAFLGWAVAETGDE